MIVIHYMILLSTLDHGSPWVLEFAITDRDLHVHTAMQIGPWTLLSGRLGVQIVA